MSRTPAAVAWMEAHRGDYQSFRELAKACSEALGVATGGWLYRKAAIVMGEAEEREQLSPPSRPASGKKYISISGGSDSTAIALLYHERGEDFEMIFADTGVELPEVYWFLPRLAAYVGRPLHVTTGGSFFKHLSDKGFLLPSRQVRWCTRSLKMIPIDYWLAGERATNIAIGIRADEPNRQRIRPVTAGDHETYWPLVEAGMGKPEVMELCRKHDMLNPIYAWRTSVSCFCCPFQRKADWLGLLKYHPPLYALAEKWETVKENGYGWAPNWTLTGLRTAAKDQVDLWPEVDEQPCVICTA